MIVGDFNAHNPLSGSDKVTDNGKVVEDVLSNLNLCNVNDGSSTYLHSPKKHKGKIDNLFPQNSVRTCWNLL